jgi:hypothetical protein
VTVAASLRGSESELALAGSALRAAAGAAARLAGAGWQLRLAGVAECRAHHDRDGHRRGDGVASGSVPVRWPTRGLAVPSLDSGTDPQT